MKSRKRAREQQGELELRRARTPQEARRQLLDLLRVEIRRHPKPVGELEAKLGRSRGYLAKVCSGERGVELAQFLEIVYVLGLDLDGFFGRGLGRYPDVESLLAKLGPRATNKDLERLRETLEEMQSLTHWKEDDHATEEDEP